MYQYRQTSPFSPTLTRLHFNIQFETLKSNIIFHGRVSAVGGITLSPAVFTFLILGELTQRFVQYSFVL